MEHTLGCGNATHKRKRTTESVLKTSTAAASCSKCGLELPSRNQLFRHLRTSKTCSSSSPNDDIANSTTSNSLQQQRVVLIVAYLGHRYHGSARNDVSDSVLTVEGCLWNAIAQALSSTDNNNSKNSTAAKEETPFWKRIQEHTNPVAMTRSSRTDKGVSALGNVYSLLLPQADVLGGDDDAAATVNRFLPDDIRLLRIISHPSIPLAFDARTYCEARRYRYLVPAKVLMASNNNKEEESIMDLRKRLKRVLLQWGGTHSFHNFTNWNAQYNKDDGENDETKRGSSGHFRHILRCHVEDVIQHDNKMDFVVISIKGQSFVYHQIRKMMGATIGIMNQSLPEDFITKAFSEKETGIDVPLAPAEGLIMVEAVYSKYCSKQKIEPIGLGTKLLHREDRNSNRSTHQEQQTAWKAAAAQLQQDTAEFQKRVYEQVCNDLKRIFQL